MAEVQHTDSGEGPPQSPPPSIGAHYTDTANGDQYLAAGVAGVGDWRKVYSDSGWIQLDSAEDLSSPVEARRIGATVYLRGYVFIPLSLIDQVIAQLPEGWEPSRPVTLVQAEDGAYQNCTVRSDGAVVYAWPWFKEESTAVGWMNFDEKWFLIG
ncbi:hypothetical protein ACSMFT_23025 [Ectopseudomonas oleovorans]|uniref:hypothetical protein n=1 Tax=Ectopseudomonas oleovorans TaxID=301 RepID=UPI003F1C41C6